MCARERVAQPVEHVTFNHGVVGSSPTALTKSIKVFDTSGDWNHPKTTLGRSSARGSDHDLVMQLAMKLQLLGAVSFSARACRLQSRHFTFSIAHFRLAASHSLRVIALV